RGTAARQSGTDRHRESALATTEIAASDDRVRHAPRGRIDNLVVKVAELCNLNCSYCFIYNHEDRSYLERPKFMEPPVFDHLLERVREYCERRAPHRISLTLHGGEPTLLGPARVAAYAHRAREVLGPHLGGLCMQSNGTLLDDEWLPVLAKHQIPI